MSSNILKKSNDDSKHRKSLRAELQYLGQMASTEAALFHEKAAGYYGLGVTDMKTISVLMQEGAMTAGQLAERLSLTTGAITSLIDRLEQRKLVKRTADPADRRRVIVSVANLDKLVTRGKHQNIYEEMGKAFDRLVSSYSTDQLEFLVEYYKTSIELTKQEIARLGKS